MLTLTLGSIWCNGERKCLTSRLRWTGLILETFSRQPIMSLVFELWVVIWTCTAWTRLIILVMAKKHLVNFSAVTMASLLLSCDEVVPIL